MSYCSLDLISFIISGNTRKVVECINKNVNVNKQFKGRFPLLSAIEKGNISIIRILLENGAFLNCSKYTITPLEHAVNMNKFGVIDILLKYGADKNDQSLFIAINNPETFYFLIKRDLNPDVKNLNSRPLLLELLLSDKMNLVDLIIDHKADLNIRDNNGCCILHFLASLTGNYDKILYMLERGANPNNKDLHGYTPLHDAAMIGKLDYVKLLIEYGGDIHIKNNYNVESISLLNRYHQKEIINFCNRYGSYKSARY